MIYYFVTFNNLGSPSWNERPENVKVHMGDKVSAKCSAFGYPKPKVIWQRYKGYY